MSIRTASERSRALTIACAFTLALAITPTNAYAQKPGAGPKPAAGDPADLKAQGDAAMDALRYDDAIALYTKAWEVGREPSVLYNRGRVYQARGDFPHALADLEDFDRDAAPALKARVPKLAELLAEVRAHVATLVIKTDVTGARVLVRGATLGTTPLAPVRTNAGSAVVEILADGYVPLKRDVTLDGGGTNTIDVTLTPVARAADGVLAVSAEGPGGVVFIDGDRIGSTPVEAQRPAGTHRIVLQREGGAADETSAVLEAGARKAIVFPAPKSDAITGKWWFWTGVGVVVVGAAATAFVLTREKSPDDGEAFSPGRVAAPLMRW